MLLINHFFYVLSFVWTESTIVSGGFKGGRKFIFCFSDCYRIRKLPSFYLWPFLIATEFATIKTRSFFLYSGSSGTKYWKLQLNWISLKAFKIQPIRQTRSVPDFFGVKNNFLIWSLVWLTFTPFVRLFWIWGPLSKWLATGVVHLFVYVYFLILEIFF